MNNFAHRRIATSFLNCDSGTITTLRVNASIVASLVFAILFASAAYGQEVYVVKEEWTLLRDNDPSYKLIDTDSQSLPSFLMGVLIDDAGALYVSDQITEKLVNIGPGRSKLLESGALGSGPEDHWSAGEPIYWFGELALTDLSNQPKVILYDSKGNYSSSVSIRGYTQLNRIVSNGNYAAAISMAMSGSPAIGMKIEVLVLLLDQDGGVLAKKLVRRVELPELGEYLREEDFWVIPRIALGSSGKLFVQSNIFEYAIDCYDTELNLLWSYKDDMSARLRSLEEIELLEAKFSGNMEVSDRRPAIRNMFVRSNGRLWVEVEPQYEGEVGRIDIQEINEDGTFNKEIRVFGTPEILGRYAIDGEWIVWWADDDVRYEKNGPYIKVGRLNLNAQ